MASTTHRTLPSETTRGSRGAPPARTRPAGGRCGESGARPGRDRHPCACLTQPGRHSPFITLRALRPPVVRGPASQLERPPAVPQWDLGRSHRPGRRRVHDQPTPSRRRSDPGQQQVRGVLCLKRGRLGPASDARSMRACHSVFRTPQRGGRGSTHHFGTRVHKRCPQPCKCEARTA